MGLITHEEFLRRWGGLPWKPIDTAPKDGSVVILTWMDKGQPQEVFAMRWCHIQRNGLFPGAVGMWTATDGTFTWNGDAEDAGPTHWITEDEAKPAQAAATN